MAAGKGERMQPLTLSTPKPLIRVNGVRLIDSVVNALRQNGIIEIYVVVGYLKEQFYKWAQEQPGVVLIENPFYDSCNNISSLYVARKYIEDCIIMDADQLICDPSVLNPRFIWSGYNAVWSDRETTEWLLSVDRGRIQSCSRNGGINGWQLFSISRWTSEDGVRLQHHLEEEFEGGMTQIYWDDVVMFLHFEEYHLCIKPMSEGAVIEIDTIGELKNLDPSYQFEADRV